MYNKIDWTETQRAEQMQSAIIRPIILHDSWKKLAGGGGGPLMRNLSQVETRVRVEKKRISFLSSSRVDAMHAR